MPLEKSRLSYSPLDVSAGAAVALRSAESQLDLESMETSVEEAADEPREEEEEESEELI